MARITFMGSLPTGVTVSDFLSKLSKFLTLLLFREKM